MRREDYPKLRDLLNESIETGRPIEVFIHHKSSWELDVDMWFSEPIDRYRVQPAPPQPNFRPMTHEELMYEVDCGTVVYGKSTGGSEIRGALAFYDRSFIVAGAYPDLATLRFASKTDDRYGQPLQVEIKDDPQ